MSNMSKKQRRHLRPSIKFGLEIILGTMLVIVFLFGLFMNHSTQLERYNDIDYTETRGN